MTVSFLIFSEIWTPTLPNMDFFRMMKSTDSAFFFWKTAIYQSFEFKMKNKHTLFCPTLKVEGNKGLFTNYVM